MNYGGCATMPDCKCTCAQMDRARVERIIQHAKAEFLVELEACVAIAEIVRFFGFYIRFREMQRFVQQRVLEAQREPIAAIQSHYGRTDN